MKFASAAIVAILAAVAEAQVAFTNSAYPVTAGQPFTLTWSGASGPVTITLKSGQKSNLNIVEVIDSNDSSNSFTWQVPTTLPSGSYAFYIQSASDSSDSNYSPSFQYEGSGTASSSVTSMSSTMAPSTSSPMSTSTSMSLPPLSTSASSSTMSTMASSTGSSSSSTHSSTKSSSTMASSSSTGSETSSTSAPETTPTNTNDGQRFQSPLALILGAVAALVYFQ